MKTVEVIVESQKGATDGLRKKALMAVCADCDGSTFIITVIDNHNHLECATCGTVFCQAGKKCQ